MTITNGYCTLPELDSYIASANAASTVGLDNRSAEFEDAITSASRMIDQHCGRIFYDTASSTARVFPATDICVLEVDDFHTLASVKTDTSGDGTFETTWTSADYQLEPLNGVANGQPGWPTYRVRAVGSRRFPASYEARVEVTATWGWSSVPAEIKRACMIQAHRLTRRPEAPEGIMGFNEFGAVRLTSIDRDVETMLAPFRVISQFIV